MKELQLPIHHKIQKMLKGIKKAFEAYSDYEQIEAGIEIVKLHM
jgi:hypothetical protein